jgi:hypothetical protein
VWQAQVRLGSQLGMRAQAGALREALLTMLSRSVHERLEPGRRGHGHQVHEGAAQAHRNLCIVRVQQAIQLKDELVVLQLRGEGHSTAPKKGLVGSQNLGESVWLQRLQEIEPDTAPKHRSVVTNLRNSNVHTAHPKKNREALCERRDGYRARSSSLV